MLYVGSVAADAAVGVVVLDSSYIWRSPFVLASPWSLVSFVAYSFLRL